DAAALKFESSELSYRELNERTNHLAHKLRAMGVGPETLVAVCAERSIEMGVALLGTMKAGGGYVSLYPGYPRHLLPVMLEDADPVAVLTLERLRDALPPHQFPTIYLEHQTGRSETCPTVITTGKDQAYVIYTSGSTGKPKGVPNVHEGIVNRLLWM